MDISLKDLKSQYSRVKKAGWLPIIARAAELSGSTTAHWLAFGSRESNLKNIRGDFRNGIWNGFGPVQVDVGTDPLFARNWSAGSLDSIERGFKRGAEIYNLKKNQIINGQGKKLKVRSKNFTGKKPVAADDLRRLSTAAYNSGLWSYYHWSFGENCDSTTTGKDYSRDVYDRAVEFAALLEADGSEPNALAKEVRLQGKYTTKDALKRAGLNENRKLLSLPKAEPMDAEENLRRASYATEEDFGAVAPAAINRYSPAEKEKPEETKEETQTEEAGGNVTNQKADNIINAPAPNASETSSDAAKIEAVKNSDPVQITEPEPTDFFGKIKKLAYGVISGTIALPFLDKVFGIQLSAEQVELLKTVFPYFFFGIIGALSIWFITKKVNAYFVTKMLADKNADPTTRNVVIVPRVAKSASFVQIADNRPHIWKRIQYAVTAKPAYLWMDKQESSEPTINAVSELSGATGAPDQQAAGKTN